MQYILNFDIALLDFLQQYLKNDFLDILMPSISMLGNGGAIWILCSVMMLCTKKYRRGGITLAAALLLCLLIGNLTLKPLVGRIRPFNINTAVALIISPPRDFSFPSGHTLSSFASAAVLVHVNKKMGVAAYMLAALIAFSRLYLYVHYPTDIIGGIVIGTAIGIVAVYGMKKINKHLKTQ